MVAQSSSYDNDNLEIGSEGSEIEIYLDSGDGGEDTTYSTSGASITNNNWHHLVVTYGDGLKVFVDGDERLIKPLTADHWILLKTLRSPLEWAGFFQISGVILMVRSMISEFTTQR
jgi:hypothetical protein